MEDVIKDKQREHKKRQKERKKQMKQQTLDDLLANIPLKESNLIEENDIITVYQKIPNFVDVFQSGIMRNDGNNCIETMFWNRIPHSCHPAVNLDADVASSMILEGENVRQNKYEKKLQKQYELGLITIEKMSLLLRQHGRRRKQKEATLKATAEDVSSSVTAGGSNDIVGDCFSLLSTARACRKQQQVENFAALLVSFMNEKNIHKDSFNDESSQIFTIVEFGSGSGNLCLALAAFFKNIRVIFIDRNPESLKLLENRAKLAGLTNIMVMEYNLNADNLKELELLHFDIGIGLHCCGSFTDMVIEICLLHQAGCIICPCCNGKMTNHNTNGYTYPRSRFMQKYITQEEYLGLVTRAADDLGNYTAKCLIEYDRALYGVEKCDKGRSRFQSVKLLKLNPVECSPKHHVLFFKN